MNGHLASESIAKPWWGDAERDHRGVREHCVADGNSCGPDCPWDGYPVAHKQPLVGE